MTPTEIATAIAEGKKLAMAWKGEPPIFDRKMRVTSYQLRRENALGERLGTVRAVYDGRQGRYEASCFDRVGLFHGELVEAVAAVDGELEAAGYKLIGRVIWR